MLERAAMLSQAVSSLERGPRTPSWSWEALQEDKREDPVLERDASYIQASTAQQVAELLRKNLADADAELRARRRLAAKAAAASRANHSPAASPPHTPSRVQQPRIDSPAAQIPVFFPPTAARRRPSPSSLFGGSARATARSRRGGRPARPSRKPRRR